MLVVADVCNGSPSCRRRARSAQSADANDFQVALRRDAAFVPSSMDRQARHMRVVFAVQKVDVRERNF